MTQFTLLIVALPNGLAPDGSARLSLYLTPKLGTAGTLADAPDLVDWTGLVAEKGLSVDVAAGSKTTTLAVPRTGLRPDLWRAVFPPHVPVAPFPPPPAQPPLILSYPALATHGFLRGAYRTAATRPNGLARGGNFSRGEGSLIGDLLGGLAFRDGTVSTLDADLAQARLEAWRRQATGAGDAAPGEVASGGALSARELATRFALYHRPPLPDTVKPLPSTPADFAAALDFHQALAAVAAHPALLRALGLVFDLVLPADAVPPPDGSGAQPTIAVAAVKPGWSWAETPLFSLPATAYVRDTAQFAAAPALDANAAPGHAPADVEDGFLTLSPDRFGVVGVDLDGGMMKAMTLADNYAAITDRSRVEQVLPALRSGGVSLIAHDRALAVLGQIADQASFHAADAAGGAFPRPFVARDLVRGYRLDIWSSLDGAWRSLHRRDGTYRVGDAGLSLTTSDEEGFTQLAATQPPADPTATPGPGPDGSPSPSTDVYLHERVARWHGWSLSAPRPGRPLNRSGDPLRATDDDPTAGTAPTAFKLTTTFSARPGTLPKLRFGARYRVRVRTVDLAGNGRALDQSDTAATAPPTAVAYHRFEPVPSPVVVPRTPPGQGASTLHLVIRSHNTSPALDTVATAETDDRHLFPPKADVMLVEHHGQLDDASGKLRTDKATYDLVVARDKGVVVPEGQPLLDPALQAVCPWFPDPIARGIALAGLPGAPADALGGDAGGKLVYAPRQPSEAVTPTMTHIGFGVAWPERQPARLLICDGTAAPTWDAATRVLTVGLPKATLVEVPVSSFMAAADLELMGVWDWLRADFEAAEASAFASVPFVDTVAGDTAVAAARKQALLTRLALEGGHEMLTPPETVTLVHAVQQPLGRPAFVTLPTDRSGAAPRPPGDAFAPLAAWRSLGSHDAVLFGALRIHGASTARIDMDAEWTDPVDDVTKPGPTTRTAADQVGKIELRTLDAGPVPADAANTAFVADYLPALDVLWFAMPTDRLQGIDSPLALTAPVHRLADTQRRLIGYRAVATSRFAEYFAPGVDLTRASDRIVVDVPSSARPTAPIVRYVVPTFGWDRQETTNVRTETRLGGGLRVYLERPWFSSGVGERLGVVLWQGDTPDDATREKHRGHFTQWGLDPIWAGGALDDVPRDIHFPKAVESGFSLTLPKVDGIVVQAMGHAVEYDAARQLWFCDIEFAFVPAYAPFVRLALARYQPGSIPGAELSPVVLADVAQLTPDRSASLSVDPADPRTGRLFVAGRGPTAPTRSLIEVTVEKFDAALGGDLAWAVAPAAEVSVTEDAPAPASDQSVLWSGTVAFAPKPAAGEYRVVIREFEIHAVDSAPGEIAEFGAFGERLVYAAILDWRF